MLFTFIYSITVCGIQQYREWTRRPSVCSVAVGCCGCVQITDHIRFIFVEYGLDAVLLAPFDATTKQCQQQHIGEQQFYLKEVEGGKRV